MILEISLLTPPHALKVGINLGLKITSRCPELGTYLEVPGSIIKVKFFPQVLLSNFTVLR